VTAAPANPPPLARAWRAVSSKPEFITLGLIVVLCLVIGLLEPRFFSPQNMVGTIRTTTRLGLFALGVLLVLAAGGIDVSFTAIGVFALYTTTTLTLALFPDAPYIVMVLIAMAMGAVLGLLNGFMVWRFAVPSLIVTIGTQYLYTGFLKTFVGTKHIMDIPDSMDAAGTAALLQFSTADGVRVTLPLLFVVLILAACITHYVLNYTLMGRAVYAVGGSSPIAQRLGFSVRTVQLFVFAAAGVLAGLGGMVHGSLNRLANPSDLVGTELDVIAAVVLGGARVSGGRGTVLGALLGVVLVVLINNSLILIGVSSTWQKVVIGAVILVASGVFSRRAA
jgi:simple sugar transport system permease protein